MPNEIFVKALNDVVTAECAGLMEYESEHIFSDEFERNMKRLAARQKKFYYHMVDTAQKRVACAAAIMLAGTFTAVMNVDATRTAIAELFIDTQPDYSNIISVDDEDAPETMEEIYQITAGLEGYTVDFEVFNDFDHTIIYKKGTDMINFQQSVKSEYDTNWNTEGASIEIITIDGYEAVHIYSDLVGNIFIWNAEDYIFSIIGNINKEELTKMAESVQKVE